VRRSAIADAAALRWAERTGAELDDVREPGPRHDPGVRSSAHAAGAALRWLEQHPGEPDPC
jgi:hypothetical protein